MARVADVHPSSASASGSVQDGLLTEEHCSRVDGKSGRGRDNARGRRGSGRGRGHVHAHNNNHTGNDSSDNHHRSRHNDQELVRSHSHNNIQETAQTQLSHRPSRKTHRLTDNNSTTVQQDLSGNSVSTSGPSRDPSKRSTTRSRRIRRMPDTPLVQESLADSSTVLVSNSIDTSEAQSPLKNSHGVKSNSQLTRRSVKKNQVIISSPTSEFISLRTALTQSLTDGTYECAICYEAVKPRQSVWSCVVCYGVLHLHCTKTWARKSQASQRQNSNTSTSGWRCPSCNSPNSGSAALASPLLSTSRNRGADIPSIYLCFCTKTAAPQFTRYLMPHTCGLTCGKQLLCDRHICTILCHPGPCDACTAIIPGGVFCFCGKKTVHALCGDERMTTGWGCEAECGEILSCGLHKCKLPCHNALCQECPVMEIQRCYCGQHTRTVKCSTQLAGMKPTPVQFIDSEDNPSGMRHYSCENNCNIPFKCGHHHCVEKCHPLQEHLQQNHSISGNALVATSISEPPCPYSPSVWPLCPCGAHTQIELSPNTNGRTSCTDPILTCNGVCRKLLDTCCILNGQQYSHSCPQPCHLGNCPPCQVPVSLKCRCGGSLIDRACSSISLYKEPPHCERVCRALRRCGRHECGTKCCPLLPSPSTTDNALRQKGKKKHHQQQQTLSLAEFATHSDSPASSTSAYLEITYHTCPLPCNRLLKCATPGHRCPLPCHSGSCPPCLEASFDDLTCACGQTRIAPPVPCGTRPPNCLFPCTRPRPCGHATQSTHKCHPDDVPCSLCVVFTSRRCVCGKTEVKNIQCHRTDIPSCGIMCGALLPCGAHQCKRYCHAGPCLSVTQEPQLIPSLVVHAQCPQLCGKKRACGHICPAPCHAPFACPSEDDMPCSIRGRVSCKCRSIEELWPCGKIALMPEDEMSGKPVMLCTDACALLERNRRLVAALDLPPERAEILPELSSDLPNYDIGVLDFAYTNPLFAKSVESSLSNFVQEQLQRLENQATSVEDTESGLSNSIKAATRVPGALHFPPTKLQNRHFIHTYALHWNLKAESIDIEPNRSVMITYQRNKIPKIPTVLATIAASLHVKHGVPIVAPGTATIKKTGESSESNALLLPKKIGQTSAVNALHLIDISPALTMLDIGSCVRSYFGAVKFEIKWHGDSDCLLLPDSRSIPIYEIEPLLKRIRNPLKVLLVDTGRIADMRLAWLGQNGTLSASRRTHAADKIMPDTDKKLTSNNSNTPSNKFAELANLGEMSLN